MTIETLTLDFPPYFQCKNIIEWMILTSEHYNTPYEKTLRKQIKKAIKEEKIEKLVSDIKAVNINDKEIKNITNAALIEIRRENKVKEKFIQGVYIDGIEGAYGYILRVSIKMEQLVCNKQNDKGYINFLIKKSKSGKFYTQKIDD